MSKSTVNKAGNYTNPKMRKAIFNRIKAGKQFVKQPKSIAKKTSRYR